MSAWMVTKNHVDVMLTAWAAWGCPERGVFQNEMGEDDFDGLGREILAENMRSVNARYCEATPAPAYSYTRLRRGATVDAVLILKAIECFAYQACESDGWATSDAHRFCEVLRDVAMSRLPGWGDAPWGCDDPMILVSTSAVAR